MSFDVVMKWPGMMGFTVLIFKQPTSPIKKCMTQGIDLVHGWGDVLKIYDVTSPTAFTERLQRDTNKLTWNKSTDFSGFIQHFV